MSTYIAQLVDAKKCFQTNTIETTAIAGLDINVSNGEFLAIMGPSGCGKSTLLSILGMLDTLSSGEYIFNSISIRGMSETKLAKLRRDNLGYIFQNYNLIESMTVLDNVLMPLKFSKLSKRDKKRQALEMLEKVKLEHRAGHLPSQLSGGQQQRVAVARALVNKPKIILADEPTGNLDSTNSSIILDLLSQINTEGTTIIMVTHSRIDAEFANRRIEMMDGKILSESRIQDCV